MSKIYVGQDFRLNLATGTDISTATCNIRYLRPDAVSGTWTGTIAATVVYSNIQASVTTAQNGFWTVWARATFSDGSIGIGEPARLTVYEEGVI